MKIVNILFNHSKSRHDNQVLGVERCFIDYAKFFGQAGDEVFCVNKNNISYVDEIKKTGAPLLQVSAFGYGDVISIFRLAFLFIKISPDISICHSGRALFFARAARFISCDIFRRKRFSIIGIDHGINPKKFLKADYVFTVNSYFSKCLVEAGKPADRAIVIPNMIEVPANFSPLEKKPFRNPIRLGSLGRIYQEKYFDKAVRALKVLKDMGIDASYVIGGVGPEEQNLNNLAKELGVEDRFKILGWTSDKRKFFDEIDIFILPSWGETFGIVLLEAMLYNTPIITSNSWGPDDIIDQGVDGIKVSKDDAEEMPKLLAEAIVKLNNDQDFARKLAVAASEKFYKNYTAQVVSKNLHDIIYKISCHDEFTKS